MKRIKINNVEDLLSISEDVEVVEISQNDVIRYMNVNRTNDNQCINVEELRNVFVESVNKAYRNKDYAQDLTLNECDIKKVCYG